MPLPRGTFRIVRCRTSPSVLTESWLKISLNSKCVRCSVHDIIARTFQSTILPNKQCARDPLPTSWLKGNVDLLAPFFVELFNQSLSMGYVSAAFREAYITPLFKKADLDSAAAKSYRPIQIYLFCRSCSSDLSLGNYSTIWIQRYCCLDCSRHIGLELSIRQRQRLSRWWLTSFWH